MQRRVMLCVRLDKEVYAIVPRDFQCYILSYSRNNHLPEAHLNISDSKASLALMPLEVLIPW